LAVRPNRIPTKRDGLAQRRAGSCSLGRDAILVKRAELLTGGEVNVSLFAAGKF